MATGSSLAESWRLTEAFWAQTLSAFVRHPTIILLYALPVAVERAWALLRTRPIPAWWIPSLDALVVLWRALLCLVALWVVLTPAQDSSLWSMLTNNAVIQSRLSGLGESIGRQLRLLGWETLFYLIAFLLLNWLVSLVARLSFWNRDLDPQRRDNQRAAIATIGRNLVLVPLALIYVAVMIRDTMIHTHT